MYSLRSGEIYFSTNFSSTLFVSFLLIYRGSFYIKDNELSVTYVTTLFCHLVIYFVALWSPECMGVLVAYVFSFRVSGVGALVKEDISKPKLYFSISPYHLFGILYGLFFIFRSHIRLKVHIAL